MFNHAQKPYPESMNKLLIGFTILMCACSSSDMSFKLAPAEQTFMQNDLPSGDRVDILWIIDNSVSMQTSQDNLRANFDAFFTQFSERNLNFHMGVATTEAWRSLFFPDQSLSYFRDADQFGTPSGFKIADTSTPNLKAGMLLNLNQGTAGNSDERAFQSITTALENPVNSGFRRPEAFLAVIILSDEDDFSNDFHSSISGHYETEFLHPVSKYLNYLDTYTGSDPTNRRYSVSSISIQDQACMDLVGGTGQKFGIRYADLAAQSDGFVGNICGNFAVTLDQIGRRILELATAFALERVPVVNTINVFVNGVHVETDPTNGWTYDATRNMIIFHGSAIPAKGSRISVAFQPLGAKK